MSTATALMTTEKMLARDPDTSVGIDVALADRGIALRTSGRTTLLEGAPILAVEILSPSDTIEDISDKVAEYLTHGVKLVWVVTPQFRTVTVHRPDQESESFNVRQTINAEPELASFECPVSAFFE